MVRLIKYHGSIIATTSVLILCISLALIKHPPLIGIWESTVVYRSFLPTTRPPLVLGIQKSANTTGHHGLFGYTLLEGSRWLADIIGHRITNIRILPVIYGLFALFFLYVITKRWFGWIIGILSVCLLATNQTFLVFQHSLLSQTMRLLEKSGS